MKSRLTVLLMLLLIALLHSSEVKSQEDSLKTRVINLNLLSSDNDIHCFNRIELQQIAKTFIELEKAEVKIEHQNKIINTTYMELGTCENKVEVLDKSNKNNEKEINLHLEKEKVYVSRIDRLKLTRNISIGLAGIFGIIAIVK